MANGEPPAVAPPPQISIDSTRGATIRTAYVEREVKAYAIFENEVQTIGMWNTIAGITAPIGAASLAFAVGIWTNAAFAEKMTAEGVVASKLVAPGLCILTLICWGIAIWAICSRRSAWSTIKTESKQPSKAASG